MGQSPPSYYAHGGWGRGGGRQHQKSGGAKVVGIERSPLSKKTLRCLRESMEGETTVCIGGEGGESPVSEPWG